LLQMEVLKWVSPIPPSLDLMQEKRAVVMYSGGKDSTTVSILVAEALKDGLIEADVEYVYADTCVEIPPMRDWALSFLDEIKNAGFKIRVVKPKPSERFFACLIGKGYPPPHYRFRWCTRRLKITPSEEAVKRAQVVVTGIRWGESRERDRVLRRACSRGGECGSGVWMARAPKLGREYLAPIAEWNDCSVWRFLEEIAPLWGWPTECLRELYGEGGLRFGCWVCTVVRRDNTLRRLGRKDPRMERLLRYKQYMLRVANWRKFPENRVWINGTPRRLSLKARRKLLDKLLKLEDKVGLELISEEELLFIDKML